MKAGRGQTLPFNLMFFFIISFLIKISYACQINWQKNFALAIDVNSKEFFPYLPKRSKEIQPAILGNGCQKTAESNKFLMITFSPQNLEFTDRVDVYDINDQYGESKCQIRNSPFIRDLTFEERKENLRKKWNAIRSCYKVKIEDKNGKSISYPEKQPGCTITNYNDSMISFNGGFCFIRPKSENDYIFTIEANEECLDYYNLNEKQIRAVDFLTSLNFYIAGDASGSSIDLTAVKSLPLRLSTNPNEVFVQNSASFGPRTPQFNANFLIPKIFPGLPELNAISDSKVHIRFPLWVDNNCEKKCFDNFCQSICDYAHPISGHVELSEIMNEGKKIQISDWYQGGVAQPKFQGEIGGQVFRIERELIKIGKKYSIKMAFNDPKYDFEQFKNMITKRINNLFPSLGQIGRNDIPNIPNVSEIRNFEEVPFINTISGVDFSRKLKEEFDSTLEGLSNYLGFRFWPPYYEVLCNENLCRDIKDDYLNLRVDFEVIGFDEETMKYDIQVLETQRSSTLLPSFKKKSTLMPYIECSV